MYSLQSKDNEITDEMINVIRYIINSAQYTDVKKSIFENGVFTETLSTILTAAIPIAILAAIYLLITRVGRKSRAKLSSEEAKSQIQTGTQQKIKKPEQIINKTSVLAFYIICIYS